MSSIPTTLGIDAISVYYTNRLTCEIFPLKPMLQWDEKRESNREHPETVTPPHRFAEVKIQAGDGGAKGPRLDVWAA